MDNQVILKREWVTVSLNGEQLIGDSTYSREWCVDVDTHGYSYQELRIQTYKDDQLLEEKSVGSDMLVRICLKGHQIKLFGLGTIKYAFPWVLFDVKA